jgi:hypothetical protein
MKQGTVISRVRAVPKASFNDGVRGLVVIVTIGVLSYLAANGYAEALGALIALSAGAKDWLFRGRTERPSEEQ